MLSTKEREKLLKLYGGLRVADVRDGLDWNGYHGFGTVCHGVRPLWRTKAVGIARTVRYLPYRGPAPLQRGDAYTEWSNWYYGNVCTYPWIKEIEPGDFVMIDLSRMPVGLMGSNNGMEVKNAGAAGFATNGGARDTDELILQQVPVWLRYTTQPMVQARLQFESTQQPIAFEGVQICPGDIVVADNDGIVVVPLEAAEAVAQYAWRELRSDKAGRRKLYEQAGVPLDETVLD